MHSGRARVGLFSLGGPLRAQRLQLLDSEGRAINHRIPAFLVSPMLGAIIGDVIGSRVRTYDHQDNRLSSFTASSRFTDDTVSQRRHRVRDSQWHVGLRPRLSRIASTAAFRLLATAPSFSSGCKPTTRRHKRLGKRVWDACGAGRLRLLERTDGATRGDAQRRGHTRSSRRREGRASHRVRGAQGPHRRDEAAHPNVDCPPLRLRPEPDARFGSVRTTFSMSRVRAQVPEAILAFLESDNFEYADPPRHITRRRQRHAGGDGGRDCRQAFYRAEIPSAMADEVLARLPADFVEVIEAFERQFAVKR